MFFEGLSGFYYRGRETPWAAGICRVADFYPTQVPGPGAEWHASDAAGVPLEREHHLAGPGVPDLHRLVQTGGGEAATVGAERHAIDEAPVSLEGERLMSGLGVPDLHRVIPTSGGDAAA